MHKLALIFFLAAGFLNAQEQAAIKSQSASTVHPPSVTAQLKHSVGLLHVKYLTEQGIMAVDGTCFFVFYNDKRGGDDFGFMYLVTNRHMAQPGVEQGKHYQILQTTLRLESSRSIAKLSRNRSPGRRPNPKHTVGIS
jgi:hypothetical protein